MEGLDFEDLGAFWWVFVPITEKVRIWRSKWSNPLESYNRNALHSRNKPAVFHIEWLHLTADRSSRSWRLVFTEGPPKKVDIWCRPRPKMGAQWKGSEAPLKKTTRIPIKDPVFSRLLPPTRPYSCQIEYLWNTNNFKNLIYSNQTRHVFETDLKSQVDRRRDFFEKTCQGWHAWTRRW